MLIEDPATGLAILAALIAVAVVGRWLLAPFRKSRAKEQPLDVVLNALADLDDDEMQRIGDRLDRLPRRDRVVNAAARQLAEPLAEWCTTFDARARERFLDLANTFLADYVGDGGGRSAKSAGLSMQQGSV